MSNATFGNYLRAARLGFHWYEPLRRFVRMSDAGPNRTLIDVCSGDRLPSKAKGEYRCWWEGEWGTGDGLLKLCPALADLVIATPQHASFVVDDAGERVP